MTKHEGSLLLGFVLAGCVANGAHAKGAPYEFKNSENRIEIDNGFRYVLLDGKREALKNCSDAFMVCVDGYLSFAIPRAVCSKPIEEMRPVSEMEFAARNHHIGRSWRYSPRNKTVIYEYDDRNDIIAIYYDFSGGGQAISKFIDAETGGIDQLSSYRLEAVKPISAAPCKDAGG